MSIRFSQMSWSHVQTICDHENHSSPNQAILKALEVYAALLDCQNHGGRILIEDQHGRQTDIHQVVG